MEKNFYNIGRVNLPIQSNPKDKKLLDLIPKKTPYIENRDILEEVAISILDTPNKPWKPVLFEGPTGVGKTAMVKYLANITNTPYIRIPINGSTSVDDFLGYILAENGSTYWRDGELTYAMRNGIWLFCDEMNAALPEVLFVLNSLLDDDKMIILPGNGGEIVKAHPNFRLFAAQNPSDEYAGTKETNKALRNRFQTIPIEYPIPQLEIDILLEQTKISNEPSMIDDRGLATRLVVMGNDIRTLIKKGEILSECSTRQLIDIARLQESVGIKKACNMVLVYGADKEDKEKIIVEIDKMFSDME